MEKLATILFILFTFGGSILLILYVPIHFSKVEHELNDAPYKGEWPKKIHFVGPLEPCRFEPYHHYMTAQSTIRDKQIGFFNPRRDGDLNRRLYQIGGRIY